MTVQRYWSSRAIPRTVSEWSASWSFDQVVADADRTEAPSLARTAAVSASRPGRSRATTVRRYVLVPRMRRATARTSSRRRRG